MNPVHDLLQLCFDVYLLECKCVFTSIKTPVVKVLSSVHNALFTISNEIAHSPAESYQNKHEQASGTFSQVLTPSSELLLQLVLILIEGRWVGLESLPLPDIKSNGGGLVAVSKRVLHISTAYEQLISTDA